MRNVTAAMLLTALLSACDSSSDALENPGGLLAGTGGATGGASDVSCLGGDGRCTEAAGLTTEDQAYFQDCCTTAGGSYGAGSCATSGTVPGSCSTLMCGFDVAEVYYTADGWDDASAQADCASGGGTWVP